MGPEDNLRKSIVFSVNVPLQLTLKNKQTKTYMWYKITRSAFQYNIENISQIMQLPAFWECAVILGRILPQI